MCSGTGFFDLIEAEVKPQIQPFYVTDGIGGKKGRWFKVAPPTVVGAGRRINTRAETIARKANGKDWDSHFVCAGCGTPQDLRLTGLRANELRSLTLGASTLDADEPYATVAPENEKARRGADNTL